MVSVRLRRLPPIMLYRSNTRTLHRASPSLKSLPASKSADQLLSGISCSSFRSSLSKFFVSDGLFKDCHNGSSVLTIKNRSLIFDTSRATGKLRRNRLKRGILSNLIIAYLLEEQNTLCTPPAGGKDQSGGNSSSANSASVSSFSFSITPSDSSRRAVSSGIR